MSSYKKLNLFDLMNFAKGVKFQTENLNKDDIVSLGQDKLFNSAISIVVNNDILTASALKICDMFPPLKILFKTTIRSYIKEYGEFNV